MEAIAFLCDLITATFLLLHVIDSLISQSEECFWPQYIVIIVTNGFLMFMYWCKYFQVKEAILNGLVHELLRE